MTLDEFEPLTKAEQAVIAGLGTGHVTVLGDGTLPGEAAGGDRQVRASLIRWLALGAPGDDKVHLHEKGLRIKGALVVSDGEADPVTSSTTPGLDLEDCTLPNSLALLACRFQHALILRSAQVRSLNLHRSSFPAFIAPALKIKNEFFLHYAQSEGPVILQGASIGGDLYCEGMRLTNRNGDAIAADGLRLQGAVVFKRIIADGEVRLQRAHIGADLDCTDVQLYSCNGAALNADGSKIEGIIFLRNASAKGIVRLIGVRIGGNLVFRV